MRIDPGVLLFVLCCCSSLMSSVSMLCSQRDAETCSTVANWGQWLTCCAACVLLLVLPFRNTFF